MAVVFTVTTPGLSVLLLELEVDWDVTMPAVLLGMVSVVCATRQKWKMGLFIGTRIIG